MKNTGRKFGLDSLEAATEALMTPVTPGLIIQNKMNFKRLDFTI